MRLVFGTTNKAKIDFMRIRAEPLGIEILSLNDVNAPYIKVDESGNTPLENARIKALAYYHVLKVPVFSCDSGLYIDGLDDARQPGVHVRNVNGKRLNDDEMIEYYSSLAKEQGGNITARYKNAICLAAGENKILEYMGEDTNSECFIITSKPHVKRREGFPLDSLSVRSDNGKYYYDSDDYYEKYPDSEDGFSRFLKKVLAEMTLII